MLKRFRSDHKLQARILFILGIALIVVSLYVQIPAWLGARYQRRMQSWRVVMPLDVNTTNEYQESFQPAESSIGNPKLHMRGPLLSNFKSDYPGAANIPDDVLQDHFSQLGIDFCISWRIIEGNNIFDSGVFYPNDVVAWSFPEYVYYKAEDYSGYRHLDLEKEYSLVVEVNLPCESMSQLKPIFTLDPPAMKNLIAASVNHLKLSIPLFMLGIFLLIVAGLKNRTSRISPNRISGSD